MTEGNIMSADLYPLLDRVCDKSRPDISTPFGINYKGRRWDAATNGSVVVMIRSSTYALRDPISGAFENLINKTPSPSCETYSMQDLRAWAGDDDGMCTVCGGDGHLNHANCGRCNGRGYVVCDLGDEHDCKNCHGKGFTADKCTACDGRRGRKILGGLIDGRHINRCLVASVIHDLPGRVVQIASTRDAVAIRGVGWVALFATVAGALPADTPEFPTNNLNQNDHEEN